MRRAVPVVAGAVAGATAAYGAERLLLRRRLDVTRAGPPLGSLRGEVRELRGPDGVRLTVETYGDPSWPTVVLAHGWTCTGRVWHEQVRGLADRFHLVTYDQPGHGRSSPPRSGRYPTALFGSALAVVLDQASGDGPVVLAGHSLGGISILNALRRHPELAGGKVSGVALLSTASRAVAEEVGLQLSVSSLARLERYADQVFRVLTPRTARYAQAAYSASSDLSHLVTEFIGLVPGADPRYVDFTEQLALDAHPDVVLGVAREVVHLDEDEGLGCLTCPTTIVCGTADRITPIELSRRMAQRCGHARLLELPGTGHMTPLEAAPAVNAVIAELVQRTLPARAAA